jgi:tetratricopeptide (TPR) repeat protein
MGGDGTGDASDEAGRDATVEIAGVATRPREEPEEEPAAERVEETVEVTVDAARPAVGPPAAEERAWSAVAAVLLNLTGLGLGYLYLRCWLRATACIVIVVLMAVVAFANDASGSPWLWRILAATWAVATALDAWGVAASRPRLLTRAQWLRPVALGVVAVLAVAGVHIGYAGAARATYAAGLEAQGRADCAAATRSFDALTGPYELTLSRDVPAAAQRRTECAGFTAAEQAERTGSLAAAVTAYQAFRREHAGSLLEPFAREGTRRALQAWAVALRGAGDLDGAIARYRELLQELGSEPAAVPARADLAATHVERASAARARMAGAAGEARVDAMRAAIGDLLLVGRELGDTPSAAGVPQAVLDTFAEANSAFAEGRFCDALPVLDYAITLPDAAGVVALANGDRARSLSECGLANFTAGDYAGAADRFETLMTDYPNDPGVAQARSALITAEVGEAAGRPLPLPAPIDAPGSEPLLVYNATSSDVRVLVTGPTAQEVTVPGCPACPVSYPAGTTSCPGTTGKPVSETRVRLGTYYVMQDRDELGASATVSEFTVRPGGTVLCVWLEDR